MLLSLCAWFFLWRCRPSLNARAVVSLNARERVFTALNSAGVTLEEIPVMVSYYPPSFLFLPNSLDISSICSLLLLSVQSFSCWIALVSLISGAEDDDGWSNTGSSPRARNPCTGAFADLILASKFDSSDLYACVIARNDTQIKNI